MQGDGDAPIDRIDFTGQSTLDGALLAQALLRLRNVETAVATGGGSGSTQVARVFVMYPDTSALQTGATVLTFLATSVMRVTFEALQSAPLGSIFHFANFGTSDVHVQQDTSVTVLSIVPGETTSLVKLQDGWFGTLGLV